MGPQYILPCFYWHSKFLDPFFVLFTYLIDLNVQLQILKFEFKFSPQKYCESIKQLKLGHANILNNLKRH